MTLTLYHVHMKDLTTYSRVVCSLVIVIVAVVLIIIIITIIIIIIIIVNNLIIIIINALSSYQLHHHHHHHCQQPRHHNHQCIISSSISIKQSLVHVHFRLFQVMCQQTVLYGEDLKNCGLRVSPDLRVILFVTAAALNTCL